MPFVKEMPLLLHELVIGSGSSATSTAPGVQKCPPHHVAIATVSHTGSTTQVTQLQQNRIVAISSNHARLNSDNSRLAEALAGNSPYSYTANSSMHIAPAIQVSYATPAYNAQMTSPSKATYSSVQSSQRYSKGMAKQSYQLPFVLQDHNYGAPPPPTPPHSPPPVPHVTVSSLSTGYKVQNVNSYGNSSPKKLLSHHIKGATDSSRRVVPGKQAKGRVVAANIPLSLNMHNNGSIATPVPNSVPTHYIASLPLHRQQFMPHPKASVFSSPINMLSPTKAENALQATAGADTDEESRLSDRGSSVGTSGEETETAPEGEGEDMLQPDDSITRCVCDMTHDDGYMIQCDRCYVWQHVDCMEIDRNNIPDEYLCEACNPRRIDKSRAKNLQMRRMQEIKINLARVSSSDSDDNSPITAKTRQLSNKSLERKVLKKKKPKAIKEVKIPRKIMPQRKTSTPNGTISNNTTASEPKELKVCKTRRRHSVTPTNESTNDTVGQIRNEDVHFWGHNFEAAVTNHYSPELRAKILSIRINGISPEFLESANGASLENRCKVIPSEDFNSTFYESKSLVATVDIKRGSAIAEYQGKYMLLSQWTSVQSPSWLHYLPYVVQYNMTKEGVYMCVDARTYGSSARFARKSSTFNAKIRHIIKRGSVHLYLVACEDIKEDKEIVLSLESAVSLNVEFIVEKRLSSVSSISQTDSASTGDERNNSSTDESPVVSPPRKNGSYQNKKTAKQLSGSISLPARQTRRTTSSEVFEELPISPVSPPKPRRSSGSKPDIKPAVKSPTKITRSSSGGEDTLKEKTPPATVADVNIASEKKDEQKMNREERKIAAIMKAFDRMEKAHQRRKDIEKKRCVDRKDDSTDQNSSIEDEDPYSTDDTSQPAEGLKRKKRSNSYSNCQKSVPENSEMLKTSPESAPFADNGPFSRFPKTKKAMMTEWLNETVDGPVLSSNSITRLETSGVKACYMRSPSLPARRPSGSGSFAEMAGRSAKKRWLRQAIIDESEPVSSPSAFCSSPNSRPDSPNGSGDYTTPLKKRRVARESMSSEHSNTPPTTPLHTSMDDDKLEIEQCLKCEYSDEQDEKPDIRRLGKDIKLERNLDQLTIDIGSLKDEVDSKANVKKEFNASHQIEVKKEEKVKNGGRPTLSLKCKSKFKPKYKKCKSKRKAKLPTSSVTNKVKANKRRSRATKQKNSVSKSKNDSRTRNKKTGNSCLASKFEEDSKTLSLAASRDAVLEVKKLKQVKTVHDTSSSSSPTVDDRVENILEDSNLSNNNVKCETEEKSECIKPVQIKRKLSISEYRKRKNASCDLDPPIKEDAQVQKKESISFDILCPSFKFKSRTPPHVKECTVIDDNQMIDEDEMLINESLKDASLQDVRSPFSDDLSCSPPSSSITLENFLKEHKEGDNKWNAAPTLLEQQRENLTARLRREFGLCIPNDKLKGCPISVSGKLNTSLVSNKVDGVIGNGESNILEGGSELNLDGLGNQGLTAQVEKPRNRALSHTKCDKL